MIKNIFLDAGGVILNEDNHEKLRAKIIADLLNTYSSGYSQNDYWQDIEEAVYRFIPSAYNYVMYKNVRDKNEYINIKSQYIEIWKKSRPELVLMKGIDKVIPVLSKRFKIGILGQYGLDLKELLIMNNLMQYFSYNDTQEQFSITKPDPRYFEQILTRANAKAEESFMVGDRIDKDVIPAKMIGMKTVRIKEGIHKKQSARVFEEVPDYEYETIFGLLDLCK